MSIILHLLFLLSFAFPVVWSETILSDSLGNAIGLPFDGGNFTAFITIPNPTNSTSIYTLNVYINNGANNGISTPPVSIPSGIESFYFVSPNTTNNGLWGNATLIRSGYSPTFGRSAMTANTTADQYLGSSSSPRQGLVSINLLFPFPLLV